uniref:Uncharacterized protein n=1 Tax=Sarcoptes scabiei TaxID=52283 RepID=A0A834VG30_SARSC
MQTHLMATFLESLREGRLNYLIGRGFAFSTRNAPPISILNVIDSISEKIPHTDNTNRISMVESIETHTSWFHLFASQWFHVLLNSLFKVLFNFPSRYLFAIGLAAIFSLGWSLPPTLSCTLKQPDSRMYWFAHISPSILWVWHPLRKSRSRELESLDNTRCTNTLTPHLLSTLECQDLALDSSRFARRY